jgi:hypothetical protein
MIDPAVSVLLTGAFALLFASAAAHKVLNFASFAAVFRAYDLTPAALTPLAAAVVALLEVGVAGGLCAGGTHAAAAAAGALLLAAYAGAIGVNLARGRRDLSCGCFGPNARQPIAPWMVWRNLLLAIVLAALLLTPQARPLGPTDGLTIGAGIGVAALLYMSLDGLMAGVALRGAGLRRPQ